MAPQPPLQVLQFGRAQFVEAGPGEFSVAHLFLQRDGLLRVQWRAGDVRLHLVANLGAERREGIALPQGEAIYATQAVARSVPAARLPRYGVVFIVERGVRDHA